MRFLSETKIDFLGARRFGFIISGALLLAGMISLFLQNGPKLGIDFTGGVRVMVKYNKPVDISSVRNALSEVEIDDETFDFSKAEIKLEHDEKTGDYFVSVRLSNLPETVDDVDDAVITKLRNTFPENVPDDRTKFTETIGPKIGSELRGKAILAIISSILMI
jgi:preprotein translocase subunit SecF